MVKWPAVKQNKIMCLQVSSPQQPTEVHWVIRGAYKYLRLERFTVNGDPQVTFRFNGLPASMQSLFASDGVPLDYLCLILRDLTTRYVSSSSG